MSRSTSTAAMLVLCCLCVACAAGQRRDDQAQEKLDPSEATIRAGKLKVACANGDMTACTDLGRMLMVGEEVEADHEQALTYFDRACGGDEAKACTNLGYMYQKGLGVYASPSKARQFYEKGCVLGEPKGCANTIMVLVEGDVLSTDVARQAGDLLDADCSAGAGKSCFALGLLHHGGFGTPADMEMAADLFSSGCESGHPESCGMRGWMEIRGQGTPWDPAAGWDHLEQGCSGGGRRSCFLLGAAQILGIAGLVDEKLGRKHVVDACEDGLEEACTFLSDHLIDEAQTASMVEDEKEFWSLDTQCRWGRVDACIEMTGEVDTHTWVFHEFELLACELGWAPSCAGFMAWIEKQVAMGSGYPGFDALAQSHIESLLDEEPSELVASEWASRSLDVGKAVLLGTDPALPRDWRAARALLSLSCGGENYEACFWLGWMWKEGIGGPGDEEKAGWYTDEAEKLRSSACSSAGGPACGFEFSPPELTE